MLRACSEDDTDEGKASCTHPVLYVSIGAWVLFAFASSFWYMRKVFRRYETTVALPVEYGTLNIANVGTGLLFYAEYAAMDGRQLALVISGCAVILLGIAAGQWPAPEKAPGPKSEDPDLANPHILHVDAG